ncbi:hypothetical protein U91I_00076 [alpha proteobacterium U9-1i]|nr:hypothetical protein U91I_00076 [alpha proteobacterium U9-1i]
MSFLNLSKTLSSRIAPLIAALALFGCDAPASQGPTATAATPPPPAPVRQAPPHAPYASFEQISVVDNLNLYSLQMGSLTVILGRTTLQDVRDAVGVGELQSSGSDESWLCYTIAGAQRVWLTSNAMSNGEFVTGVRAASNAAAAATGDCPTLPAAYARIALDPGLWLGAPLSQVEHRLGDAAPISDWRYYNHTISGRRDRLDRTETHNIAVRVVGDSVVALDAERLVTN